MPLINPETVSIPMLPSVPFSDWKLIPEKPGIYFIVLAEDESLLYIGCSHSLQRRMLTHDKKYVINNIGPSNVHWLLIEDGSALVEHEELLIAYFRPLLNNGGPHPLKRGPRPKGFERHNLFLPEALAEWAKAQPEGLSGLVRLLLTQERPPGRGRALPAWRARGRARPAGVSWRRRPACLVQAFPSQMSSRCRSSASLGMPSPIPRLRQVWA